MIYFIHKDEQSTYVCDAHSRALFDAFTRHGARVISESNFLSSDFSFDHDDSLIACVSLKTSSAHEKFAAAGDKWLYSIDESKSDGIVFRTQLDFMQRTNTSKMLNTYPSSRNINVLNEHGIKFITFPICGSNRNVTDEKKHIDILVSGQLNANYYPMRTRLANLLQVRGSEIHGKIVQLQHSGFNTSTSRGVHGKDYLELLDTCWMGVTCKAGSHDRMVAKYVEFGFSRVLPIGDCPSYMPNELKKSMLAFDEYDSDDKIICSLNSMLDNRKQLIDRINVYHDHTNDLYDIDKNTERVIRMIRAGEFER